MFWTRKGKHTEKVLRSIQQHTHLSVLNSLEDKVESSVVVGSPSAKKKSLAIERRIRKTELCRQVLRHHSAMKKMLNLISVSCFLKLNLALTCKKAVEAGI